MLLFQLEKPSQIKNAKDALPYLENIRGEEQEHFKVIFLNGNHKVTGAKVITKGLLNSCSVHPREVFKEAIIRGSASIVIAHNHPSGNTQPIHADREITQKLSEAGEIIGIQVLDHIIVTEEDYYSFKEQGSFPEETRKWK